jgi:hypothetical protein
VQPGSHLLLNNLNIVDPEILRYIQLRSHTAFSGTRALGHENPGQPPSRRALFSLGRLVWVPVEKIKVKKNARLEGGQSIDFRLEIVFSSGFQSTGFQVGKPSLRLTLRN